MKMSEKSAKIVSNIDNKAENIDKNNKIKENSDENEKMDTNGDNYCEDPMDESDSETDIQTNEQNNGSEDEKSISSEKCIESKVNKILSNDRNTHKNEVLRKDMYCWDCHKEDITHSCRACQRSYHQKCSSLKNRFKINIFNANVEHFLCPECEDIMRLEEADNGSGSVSSQTLGVNRLTQLLKYTIITVKAADRNQKFSNPVSVKKYPDYQKLIVNPMDLSLIERNVKNGTYGSTNSFLADVKWIYHNCFIFNCNSGTALLTEAKNIIRVAKQECEEIEICPDCYYNYYYLEEKHYFASTCVRPHAIVWAKLSGHPYWPAKVVRFDLRRNLIDVRFFGTHDKCWLKPENCYFMSKEYPYNKKPSKFDETKFNDAISDMNLHLDNLENKNPGLFKFYEKNVHFNTDKIYLTKDEYKGNNKLMESYNGIKIRKLTVNPKPLNINIMKDEMKKICSQSSDDSICSKPSNNKKFKRSISSNSSNDSPKLNTNRCFSQMTVRKALHSSIESYITTENTIDSEVERSVNNDFESDFNSDEMNDNSQENSIENNSIQMNSENSVQSNELKLNTSSPHSKTVTVMGKTSEIQISRNDEFIDKTNSDVKNGKLEAKIRSQKLDESPIRPKFKPKMSFETNRNSSSDKLRINSLVMKNKQMQQKLTNLENKVLELEEESQEYKYKCEELEKSIDDIKKKQWCNNCLKEAILPCCWNTCYCTVECQHQHWPIHSKTCRRRQITTTNNQQNK